MGVTNTPAYFGTGIITAVESFIDDVLDVFTCLNHIFEGDAKMTKLISIRYSLRSRYHRGHTVNIEKDLKG